MNRESPPDRALNPLPRLLQFVAVKCAVMRGREHIATATSTTMATRIARALNQYKPGPRGY